MVHISRDLRYLYKLDSYDELPEESEGLQEAWSKIYEGWGKLIGGNKASLSFLKQKQQAARKYNYNFELTMYRMVQRLPIPEVVERFNALGYNVDLEDYEGSMKRAYSGINKKR